MSVKINSLGQIAKRLGLERDGPAQAFLVETCYKAMDEFVPRRNGDLRRQIELTKRSITYATPYAKIQYHGIIYGKEVPEGNYTTPGTGPYWDRRMLSIKRDKIAKQVQAKYGRH